MTKRPVDILFPEAKRESSISEMRCVAEPFGCGKRITRPFRDELSRSEYQISGLCQKCQDTFFTGGDDE